MMRYGTPIMVAGIALLSMNSTKLLSKLLPADIAAEVGVYSACYSWVCSWFCIEQPIL
jgi:hypothetical protein